MTMTREGDPDRALREQEVSPNDLACRSLRYVRGGVEVRGHASSSSVVRFATWSGMWNNSYGRARSTHRTPL